MMDADTAQIPAYQPPPPRMDSDSIFREEGQGFAEIAFLSRTRYRVIQEPTGWRVFLDCSFHEWVAALQATNKRLLRLVMLTSAVALVAVVGLLWAWATTTH